MKDELKALGHPVEPEKVPVPLEHRNRNTVCRTDGVRIAIQTMGSTTEWISTEDYCQVEDTGETTDEVLSWL